MSKFQLGKTTVTKNVARMMEEKPEFQYFVIQSLNRFVKGDWGDMDKEDKALNDYAVDHQERILAAYKNDLLPTIFIITEWNRSGTMVLFPEEY